MADSKTEDKKPVSPKGTDSFDKRHEKELGVGRFVTVSGINIVVPLATMAAGGVLGYLTLGKPIKAMFPRMLKWGSDIPSLVVAAYNFEKGKLPQLYEDLSKVCSKSIEHLKAEKPGFKVETIADVVKVIETSSKFPEETAAVRGLLKMPEPDLAKNAKYVGAGVGAFFGSMFGGMAVNYNEWRKDESARLAAEEVNKNISQMEIFKPSDPELVSENKRLRAMLAEKEDASPKPNIHAAKPDGKITSASAEVAVG